MDTDKKLLKNIYFKNDIWMHLHNWNNYSATYGIFCKPQELMHLDVCGERGVDLARRPSGGGVIFHGDDLSFALIVGCDHPLYSDNVLQSYRNINSVIMKALLRLWPELEKQDLGLLSEAEDDHPQQFCMAKPTIYDVVVGGQKVVGAAQRKKPNGVLHQASICLRVPDPDRIKPLLKHTGVYERMQEYTYPLLGSKASAVEYVDAKKEMEYHLQKLFQEFTYD